jgi:hypothetical protein
MIYPRCKAEKISSIKMASRMLEASDIGAKIVELDIYSFKFIH